MIKLEWPAMHAKHKEVQTVSLMVNHGVMCVVVGRINWYVTATKNTVILSYPGAKNRDLVLVTLWHAEFYALYIV